MNTSSSFQYTLLNLDRRWFALVVGLVIGVVGGALGLGLATLGAIPTLAIVFGMLVGLYVLTDVQIALSVAILSLLLLPFGTLPFSLGVTPTFLDLALAAFLLVYLVRRMTRQLTGFHLTPVHGLLALYIMWVVFAFVLGLQYGNPTSTVLRRFAETLLALSLPFLLVDLIRDGDTLKRLLRVIILAVGVQAMLALVLFFLPDATTENLLVRLARIGYPNGGVVRYIESNPELGERAIGTWVDPNALGGILAVSAMLIAPQIIAKRPVLRQRWLTALIFLLTAFALYLTNSRASFLALGFGIGVIVLLRYRRFIPLLLLAGILFFLLPQTQNYIDRIFQAFQGEDLSTQMRIGEWTDALELISRYPLTGIGFTGTPFRNVYTDVANMYLIMANQIGLTGVFLFLLAMGGVMLYGLKAWQTTRRDPDLEAVHLGLHLALATGLINAIADLYFFRLDFQSSITYFWLIVALCVCVSRLGIQQAITGSALPKSPA
jgi:O-antigen ligase